MASIKEKHLKSGQLVFEITCSRGTGKSQVSMRWHPPEGWSKRSIDRELTKIAADFQRKVEAGEILSRAEQKEIEAETQREAAKILTMRQYGERVFMPSKAVSCAEHTREYYQAALDRYIYPSLGERKLPEITPAQITALLLEMQKKGYSHSTTVGAYITMNQLFKMAFLSDVITVNPMLKVQRPRQTKQTLRTDTAEAYTVEELNQIIKALEEEPLKWRAMLLLMIDSGIRRGEACGLRWECVDFEEGTVTIAANLCYTKEKGVFLDTPKSGRARTIDVDPVVLELLRKLRLEQASASISHFVFTQEGSADPMHPQSPTRYMKKLGTRCGLPDLHPHKLRHSFASVAITHGADIASISQKLGHADKGTTLRMYTHADQESIKRAGNVFREALKVNREA